MENTNVNVGLQGLSQLQVDLLSMSDKLHELSDTLHAAVHGIESEWQDDQFDEFANAFKAPMDQLDELAEKYQKWANDNIQKVIDAAHDVKNIHVNI